MIQETFFQSLGIRVLTNASSPRMDGMNDRDGPRMLDIFETRPARFASVQRRRNSNSTNVCTCIRRLTSYRFFQTLEYQTEVMRQDLICRVRSIIVDLRGCKVHCFLEREEVGDQRVHREESHAFLKQGECLMMQCSKHLIQHEQARLLDDLLHELCVPLTCREGRDSGGKDEENCCPLSGCCKK